MEDKTSLEKISDLYDIAEYMQDEEFTKALEFIAKAILKPDIPPQVVIIELVKLQSIGAKMALKATWMANVDKNNRAKKNLYYTASNEIDKICQSLKWYIKS